MPFLITLVLLGLGGGVLSGLLGLGGAIFMIPLLLYVPPMLGVGQLDMKQVAAVSMVQVLSASISGLIVHNKNKFVSKSLLIYMGLMNALGNLIGSVFSNYTKSGFLLAIFATMAVIAAVVMFVPKREQGEGIPPEDLIYNKPLASGVSLAIGCFGGMVGAPGAFIYIPVMIYLLNIPTRIVIGSTLGIVMMGAVMGTIGKMATGQIIWPYAIALVIGTVPGAQIGGRLSKRVNTKHLRYAIAVIIAITGIRMWWQVATGG
ncbi:MAG: sulfite exporter TauE/SafE family protein [Nitrospirae bacterium]|nr:sulfite exporter TauE/SafE family protein [Nitrospirota bacterium]MBI5694136.1 sulfite exporter TauE/SafE family protein [Nitrospirota bacterium]